MKTTPKLNKINGCGNIEILVFNIMGVRVGMDMEQIDEIIKPDQVKIKKLQVFKFHEKMPFRGKTVVYKLPSVLLLKEEKIKTGIIIDQPEEMITVPIDSIQPLPPLMEAGDNSSPIWGVTLKNDGVVLLVDFYKLMKCKTIKNT